MKPTPSLPARTLATLGAFAVLGGALVACGGSNTSDSNTVTVQG